MTAVAEAEFGLDGIGASSVSSAEESPTGNPVEALNRDAGIFVVANGGTAIIGRTDKIEARLRKGAGGHAGGSSRLRPGCCGSRKCRGTKCRRAQTQSDESICSRLHDWAPQALFAVRCLSTVVS